VIELAPYPPAELRRSRLAAVSGVLSVALLGACLRWAHHWGVRTDTPVAGWAFATLTAIVVSSRLNWRLEGPPLLRKIGLSGGLLSLGTLPVIGLLYLAGLNVAGACGGG
jgi:hypothetical protein